MDKIFDEYSFKARLIPAFLVLLPIALAAWPWIQDINLDWKLLGGILVYCGGTLFLAQLGRDQGRQKEPGLFLTWGGKPTTRMLRHRHSNLDKITLDRYHKKLAVLLGKDLPTRDQEMEEGKTADELYEAGVKVLLEQTRDKQKFPLIFKENVDYGFRRNLWGMKPSAILICLLSIIADFAPIIIAASKGVSISVAAVISTVCVVILLTWWCLRITPNWVRLAADAYAMRLLASSEQL